MVEDASTSLEMAKTEAESAAQKAQAGHEAMQVRCMGIHCSVSELTQEGRCQCQTSNVQFFNFCCIPIRPVRL